MLNMETILQWPRECVGYPEKASQSITEPSYSRLNQSNVSKWQNVRALAGTHKWIH